MSSRNTRQREYIFDCIKNNADRHLTIKDIENILKNDSKPVGIATIYRYLNKLVDLNIVRKFKPDEQNRACYQYIGDNNSCCEYFHLICSKCSGTMHFQNEKLNGVFREINENCDFNIDYPKSIFYGVCDECINKKL